MGNTYSFCNDKNLMRYLDKVVDERIGAFGRFYVGKAKMLTDFKDKRRLQGVHLLADSIHGTWLFFTRTLGRVMYSNRRKTLQTELSLFEFKLPFGGTLGAKNRWIKLATLIPWDEVEADYCHAAL
jgi:hypothetical protein